MLMTLDLKKDDWSGQLASVAPFFVQMPAPCYNRAARQWDRVYNTQRKMLYGAQMVAPFFCPGIEGGENREKIKKEPGHLGAGSTYGLVLKD